MAVSRTPPPCYIPRTLRWDSWSGLRGQCLDVMRTININIEMFFVQVKLVEVGAPLRVVPRSPCEWHQLTTKWSIQERIDWFDHKDQKNIFINWFTYLCTIYINNSQQIKRQLISWQWIREIVVHHCLSLLLEHYGHRSCNDNYLLLDELKIRAVSESES